MNAPALALKERQLEPEWLDLLPAEDPRAVRSRRDLRLVNFLMGHRRILRRTLLESLDGVRPARIAELGAGDGTLMLALARDLAGRWPAVDLELVDRQRTVRPGTMAEFERLGWSVSIGHADLMSWLSRRGGRRIPVILANLVLHHFDDAHLADLFARIAAAADGFIAAEPRRSRLALAGGRALGLLGCNDVTRHDAVVSVRAGFRNGELSRLWPDPDAWRLSERAAGCFSHVFVARRK